MLETKKNSGTSEALEQSLKELHTKISNSDKFYWEGGLPIYKKNK